MATVVVKNANKGVIFACDEWYGKWRVLNLETYFLTNCFDIKVLDDGGCDIVASGSPFISDIVFSDIEHKDKLLLNYYKVKENHEKYVMLVDQIFETYYDYNDNYNNPEPVPLDKEKMTTVDYENPSNWALTYKMRGFANVQSKRFPRGHPMMNSYTASGLLKAIKGYEDNEEVVKIKSPLNVKPRHMTLFQNYYKNMVESHQKMFIYVENKFILPKDIEIRERTLPTEAAVISPSKIFDFYNKGSVYGTMIGLSVSPRIADYFPYTEGDGWHKGAINYYNNNRGIVLPNIDAMYYGRAMKEEIYVPDVLYEVRL